MVAAAFRHRKNDRRDDPGAIRPIEDAEGSTKLGDSRVQAAIWPEAPTDPGQSFKSSQARVPAWGEGVLK